MIKFINLIIRWALVLAVLEIAHVGLLFTCIIVLLMSITDEMIVSRTLHRLAEQMVDSGAEIVEKEKKDD